MVKAAVRFTGNFKSSHFLIALLAVLCIMLVKAALGMGNQQIQNNLAYWAMSLFSILVLIVIGRYALKGPEAEREQTSLSVNQNELRFLNIDIANFSTPPGVQLIDMIRNVVASRRPLPPATSVLTGKAADFTPQDNLETNPPVSDPSNPTTSGGMRESSSSRS